MSSLNINPKGLALGVLAVGGLWWLTQRGALAGQGGNFRSPLQLSPGVQTAARQFFVSPSIAGQTVPGQASDAARNARLIDSGLGFISNWLSPTPLQASVTDAVPASMRLSERASYDVAPADSVLSTGDFSRMDRMAVSEDGYAANLPGYQDPYDVPGFWMP